MSIELAGTLGLGVIAEGGETREQHRCLLELGCRHAQGSLYAEPMPVEAIVSLVGPGVTECA